MSNDSQSKSASDHVNKVAEAIIDQIEKGTAPWMKPWETQGFMPYNALTGRDYRGANALFLDSRGHADPRWMTFKQAKSVGAAVKPGEKGTQIEYWKFTDEREKQDENGKPVIGSDGKPEKETVSLVRPRRFVATVFNADQIEGLPPLSLNEPLPETERHEAAERILSSSGADIQHAAGDRAFYSPAKDSITLPLKEQFKSGDNYYATALHELGHWTGHPSRLDRDLDHPFGSKGYAKEELRAEISSMILGNKLGIGHDPSQHAAYAQSWLKVLKDDPQEIFRAAADAEKISDFVIGLDQDLSQRLDKERESRAISSSDIKEIADQKIWLNVPKEERKEAKALALQNGFSISWNPKEEKWSAPKGANLAGFDKWLPTNSAGVLPKILHDEPEKDVAKSDRIYLAVPFAENRNARQVAYQNKVPLEFDKEAKAFHVPAGTNLEPFKRWVPSKENTVSSRDFSNGPSEEFGKACLDAGLILDGAPILDGKLHRCRVQESKSSSRLSGSYVGYMNPGGVPAGVIENFASGLKTTWVMKGGARDQLSPEQKEQLKAESAQRRREAIIETRRGYESTALVARKVWGVSPRATPDNAYCKAKGITDTYGLRQVPNEASEELKAMGVRIAKNPREAKAFRDEAKKTGKTTHVFMAGDLLIPGFDSRGKVWTLQAVNPNFKSFMKGGAKTNKFAIAGVPKGSKSISEALEKGPLVIAEGYATASSVSKMLEQPVVVAFDSGNLLGVAKGLRNLYPDRPILIAADNDHEAPLKVVNGRPGKNVGLSKAEAAAKEVGGGVAAPPFGKGEKGSDWNDFLALHGEEKSSGVLAGQVNVALMDASVAAEKMKAAAHDRIQEAVNDGSTDVDDQYVADERQKANELIADATEQKAQAQHGIRSAAAKSDSVASKGAAKGESSPSAADGVHIPSGKVADMQHKAESERSDVNSLGNRTEVDVDPDNGPQKTPKNTKPVKKTTSKKSKSKEKDDGIEI